ncbi:MAG TPA: F0F1 ATP synthase subunit delta, partial [Candidatus Berkiella sp.]|nr:F0F1 ATP synthase subunit delta [Candidatus Berkiella sp.]
MLHSSALIANDEQFQSMVKDPRFSTSELVGLFEAIDKEDFSEQMRSFLAVLGKFKRLALIPEIAHLYEEMRSVAERTVNVELISAQPLSEKD